MSIVTYPRLPKDEPKEVQAQPIAADVQIFRLTNITQIQRELEQDLAKYNKTKRKYSSVFNVITYVNTGSTTVAALTTGTGAVLVATGVGSPMGFALGFVSLSLGACSIALGTVNKQITTKLQKHTAIVQLITAKLSSFRLIISKALADYDDYKRQKFEQQKKTKATFSQPPDVEAIKKKCLEQVNATLNPALKK